MTSPSETPNNFVQAALNLLDWARKNGTPEEKAALQTAGTITVKQDDVVVGTVQAPPAD